MLKLTYRGRLLGVNEFVNANRIVGELKSVREIKGAKNRRRKRFYLGWQTKKTIQDGLAAEFHTQANGVKFAGHVSIYIAFFEKDNRRDDDNVTGGAKFILDALTQAGIIPDDSPKYCHVISERFTLTGAPEERKGNARIEVRILPDKEGRFFVGKCDKYETREGL